MGWLSHSKLSRFVSKLAVEYEDGLTNAQLMLVNEDLKPGEAVFPLPFIVSACFGRRLYK